MLPQFGEYVSFKLDPVASLKALNDPDATKASEALQSDKTYVSCVTYLLSFPLPGVEYISGNMILLARGLPNGVPDAFNITSDMSMCVLPNTSIAASATAHHTSPLTRLLSPHSSNGEMSNAERRRHGSDLPDPKYRLTGWDRILLAQTYFSEDGERRGTIKREQESHKASTNATGEDVSTEQPQECQSSTFTLPVPGSEPGVESQ
ncbi:hypothetical protein EV421DRAFT_1910038 [Armillaria borealis]|uniref:Uncharacterized protein n=1 Tax=Armillaria borealis TaxID=47425 RepID=A0AA39IZU0_9AGAR|nr:hypothetical protein EV421DRAFT_1910038 [Armillaria borealis]